MTFDNHGNECIISYPGLHSAAAFKLALNQVVVAKSEVMTTMVEVTALPTMSMARILNVIFTELCRCIYLNALCCIHDAFSLFSKSNRQLSPVGQMLANFLAC